MGGGGGGGATGSRSLQDTPTWALATVCFVFIFFGIFIEHLIHLVSHWLKKHKKNALFEAVEKLKSVLMLLGFMSLLLAVTQRPIAKICIPNRIANSMLPCRKGIENLKTTKSIQEYNYYSHPAARGLAAASSDYCASKGMASLISEAGINELNILIFVLAVMQIVYTVATMALGRAKMRRWKAWEKETQTVEYLAANDPNRFRFTRQTTFAKRHTSSCTTTPTQLWLKCFFRQFFHSVEKVDYLTLRHGFISAHMSTSNTFDFQKYIQRSLEDDFKLVVGISPPMWLLVVILLLLDVYGWHMYLWVSFVPLTIVLVLGTKLEVVVASMALQLKYENNVIKGTPLVQPNDNLFWFSHPSFVLTLLHFTLFMNAFELAFIVWATVQFGMSSCYHDNIEIIVLRTVLAVMAQVLCSYITLPLYALVTQMGSQFKSAVLEEHTVQALKQWHAKVREKKRKERPIQGTTSAGGGTSVNGTSPSPSPSPSNHLSSHSHFRTPTLAEFAAPSTSAAASTNEIVEHRHLPQQSITNDHQMLIIDFTHLPPNTPPTTSS